MWALTLDPGAITAAGAALAAAFLSSVHCVAMCGPLRLLCGSSSRARLAYQLGRGLSYAVLGTLAGAAGASLPPLLLIAALAAAVLLLIAQVKFSILPERLKSRLYLSVGANPLLLGIISGALPCGLLHGWVLAAAATASPLRGGGVLMALWLGTLPALEAGPRFLATPLQRLRAAFPRATVIAIICLAAAPAAWRVRGAFSSSEAAPTCHPAASHSLGKFAPSAASSSMQKP